MSEQIQTEIDIAPAPLLDTDVVDQHNQEEKRRLFERFRARPEFMATMGALALEQADVSIADQATPAYEKLGKVTAYNQEEKPQTFGDKRVARKLQKRLDAHAHSIDHKLSSKKDRKNQRESQLDVHKRHTGNDDLRLRAKATIRSIKKAEKQAKKAFKRGEMTATEFSKPHGEAVYRKGTGRFSGSAGERAHKYSDERAQEVRKYGRKLSDKAGRFIIQTETIPQEYNSESEHRYQEDAPKLFDAIERRYRQAIAAKEASGEVVDADGKAEASRQVFLEVAAKYFGVELDSLETSGHELATLERILDEERLARKAAQAPTKNAKSAPGEP